MRSVHSRLPLFCLLVGIAAFTEATAADAPSAVQLEALKRLQGVDLGANPSLKATVLKIVEGTRGTPQFVELVEQFKLTGQSEGLLQVALQFPGTEAGVRAIRLVHEAGDVALIKGALAGGETNARWPARKCSATPDCRP